jgi:hypothetical protein
MRAMRVPIARLAEAEARLGISAMAIPKKA